MKNTEQETTALAVVKIGDMALVSVDEATRDSKQDLALNPEFEQADIRVPQLKICQSMTPQRKKTDLNYIKGLEEGDFFNDASTKIYGPGPLQFVMLKYWLNFLVLRPLEQGGGIISRGVLGADGLVRDEAGKVLRTEFGAKGEKPEVTKFMNYLFYLPETNEIVWFSAKSTFLKPMRGFHGALRNVQGIADYRKVFTITAQNKPGASPGQEYFVPVIPKRPIGIIPADSELGQELKKFAKTYADKTIDTSVAETADDEDTIDGEVVKDDIPF